MLFCFVFCVLVVLHLFVYVALCNRDDFVTDRYRTETARRTK